MGIQERMERRWLGRTAPARAAAAATQARELAYRAGQRLNGGFAADVADKTRAVMAVAVVMRLSAVNTRAFVLSGRGRHSEAESVARSALRETPADLAPQLVTTLTVNLARALGGQQRYEEAEMALGELRPDDAREIILVTCSRAAARLG